jgi:transcriptional regulator with XRE-family HTH domain
MLTRIQVKLARTALGWTVRDLAQRADVVPNTVNRLETGKQSANNATLTRIRNVFEAEGIGFPNPGTITWPKRLEMPKEEQGDQQKPEDPG